MTRYLLICIAVYLLASPLPAQDFWRQTPGPQDGTVPSLVSDSAGTIYLTSDAGWKSTDDGVTWVGTRASLLSMSGSELAGGESSGELYSFFLGWPSGLLRSSDQGTTWTRLSTGTANRGPVVYALAAKPGLIFMSDDGNVLRYDHRSGSWDSIHVRPEAGRESPANLVSWFAIAPDGAVYAVTDEGLVRSTDDGDTWIATGEIPGSRLARSIHVSEDGVLYAATDDTVYRSTDAGAQWSATSLDLRGRGRVVIATKGSDLVLVGCSSGLLARSTDGGTSWSVDESSSMHPLTILVTRTGTVLIGSAYGGVYRSTDDGATWASSNYGMASAHASVIAAAPNGSVHVVGNSYLGQRSAGLQSSASLWSTSDHGESWRAVRLAFLGTCTEYALVALPDNVLVLGATCGGIYQSTDNGATWINRSSTGIWSVSAITLLAGGDLLAVAGNGSGLHRSSDAGMSWRHTGSFSEQATALIAHSSGRLIAGTRGGVLLVSDDEGATWTPTVAPTGIDEIVSITERRGRRLFAATQSRGVLQSTDAGATWVRSGDRVSNTMGNAPTIFADRNGDVYLAGYDKPLFRTTDNGLTWSEFASGLPRTVTHGFARDSSGHLWTGAGGSGLFRSTVATAAVRSDDAARTASASLRLAPNPVGDDATFSLTLRSPAAVRLRVYDAAGTLVATVVDAALDAGAHEIRWSAEEVAAGAYYYVLAADGDIDAGGFVVAR